MSEGPQFEVNLTFYPAAIEAIKQSDDTRVMVSGRADMAAAALRSSAPTRSGAGRASINSMTERDFETGWVGKASWDDEHYYMGIQNSRTGWANSAASRVRYV